MRRRIRTAARRAASWTRTAGHGPRAEARRVLDAERALQGPRLRSSWDEAADAAYVATWSAAPGPVDRAPWVTVVMPVRNRPRSVVEAIRSVQAQTLHDWVLVVVDDGSSDETADVVERLAADDPRITLLRRDHEGVCRARNAGIAAATTPYIAFLDSDNTWTPAFLRTAVAALHAAGGAVGHAVVDELSEQGHRFRAFDGQEPHLRTGNFVDLNVLVARTDEVRQIGGFDPTLRRMVDYDLVWRLAKLHRLHLLPFVGVRYAAHAHLADRISVTEPFAWDDVVKARNLVDRDLVRAGLTTRRPGLVSVVVPHRGDVQAALATMEGVVSGGSHDVELVIVDVASPPAEWQELYVTASKHPQVRVERSAGPLDRAAAVALGVAASTGGRVVVVPSGIVPGAGAVEQLAEALLEAPLAVPIGDPVSGVVAARADALVDAGGLDPLLSDEYEVADLVRRLASHGQQTAAVAASLDAVRSWPSPTPARHEDNQREWARRWPGSAPGSLV